MGLKGMEGGRRVGLEGVKGIGFNGVTAIMKARQAGPFKSLFDFTERVEEGSINKRVLEGLVYSGAFDSLKPSECTSNQWRAPAFAPFQSRFWPATHTTQPTGPDQRNSIGSLQLPIPHHAP